MPTKTTLERLKALTAQYTKRLQDEKRQVITDLGPLIEATIATQAAYIETLEQENEELRRKLGISTEDDPTLLINVFKKEDQA